MPVMRIYLSSIENDAPLKEYVRTSSKDGDIGRYPTVRNYVNMNLRNPDEVAIVKVDDCHDYDYYLMRCSVSLRSGAIISREIGKVKIIEGV